jgi:2-(1,2-epoxy-1,2-dihydrophenyl)acetyl-CoA isomerase
MKREENMVQHAYETVHYESDGAIATVTLNRPTRRNSIAGSMLKDLNHALERAIADEGVRVLVLTGAGRDFCPGADLDATAGNSDAGESSANRIGEDDFRMSRLLHEMPAVTIAAVNGACAGAGLGWAAACDMRVAADSARFNTAFLDVGVAGDMGGPWTLSRIVGPAKMRELYLLPGKFDAAEALRIGLVSRVWPEASFRDEVKALAERIASAAPLALRTLKANFLTSERASLADYLAIESQRHMGLFRTEDTKEAFRAIVEKRKPRYVGR